ncbi:MAG: calcium/sodium antiporter, partial [Pseudomonadota bacterium]
PPRRARLLWPRATRRRLPWNPTMLIASLSVVIGLTALLWSADRFVAGASAIAARFGLSPILVGAVIVGFGTSSPELFIATLASVDGSPGIAVGNALGSNIANIGLILGVVALVAPVHAIWADIRRDAIALIGATGLVAIAVVDGHLGRLEGAALTVALLVYLGYAIRDASAESGNSEVEDTLPEHADGAGRRAWFQLFLGFSVLLVSSRLLVSGAEELARIAGLSELVIGLTIIAIGSSLPELAASLAAAARGRADMALGNVVGSNVFNSLAVLAIPAWIAPGPLEDAVAWRDLPLTVVLTASVLWLCARKSHRIHRAEGVLLLVVYCGYLGYLGWQAMA